MLILTRILFWPIACFAFAKKGFNLIGVLYCYSIINPNKKNLISKNEWTARELYEKAIATAEIISKIEKINRIGLVAGNDERALITIMALNFLGIDCYLINPNLAISEIRGFVHAYNLDELIVENNSGARLTDENVRIKSFSEINGTFNPEYKKPKSAKRGTGKITVLSSGSNGQPKAATRSNNTIGYLFPFVALFVKLKLWKYDRILVAPPIYHGYGLAASIMSIVLGKKLHLTSLTQGNQLSELIEKEKIEIFISLPVHVERIKTHLLQNSTQLQKIISGGALLSEETICQVSKKHPQMIFNLYGTSESGFCLMATPKMLQNNPSTIGKPIIGSKVKIDYTHGTSIGNLLIKTSWKMIGEEKWIDSGDLAFCNDTGLYFLAGRKDDLIISGGENIYLSSLQSKIGKYSGFDELFLIDINDVNFGQVIACCYVINCADFCEKSFTQWIKNNFSRHENPKYFVRMALLPKNEIGKIKKPELRASIQNEIDAASKANYSKTEDSSSYKNEDSN